MDRLNRMLHAAQGMGMGMGSAAPGGVSVSLLRHLCCLRMSEWRVPFVSCGCGLVVVL